MLFIDRRIAESEKSKKRKIKLSSTVSGTKRHRLAGKR